MKRNSINFLHLTCCFFLLPRVSAQYIEAFPISASNADKMLELKNYQQAIRQFSSLLNEEPNNIEYKFKLGKSYTYSNIDKQKGLEILKKLSSSEEAPKEIKKELAIAHFNNYEFEAAETLFTSYKAEVDDNDEKLLVDQWLKKLKSAKQLYENPLTLSFENLGRDVNSKAPDYLPVCEPDESSIYFTSRRVGVQGNLYDYGGYRTADVYLSKHKRNNYSRARSVGSPNTYGNEQTAGRSENGEFIIYNVNSEDYFNDLFMSEKGRRSFMPPKEFDSKEVNLKSNEMGASLSNDGTVMYFCSDREGGLGGFDIYMVKRLPTGVWGEPKNIGPPINTSANEQYPMLEDNGNTLYFSSNGHPGMGEMDLFKSLLLEEDNWSTPLNLGYPVNTTANDLNISFASNKRYAYIAANRDDSFGDLDIYRITFENTKDNFTLLKGIVLGTDSVIVNEEMMVEIYDLSDNSLYGTYLVSEKSGKYSAILPAGYFRVEVVGVQDHNDYMEEIKLLGKNDFQEEKELIIVLQKTN